MFFVMPYCISASQAIFISNKAIVNEKRTDEMIKQLLLEKEALLKELNEARSGVNTKFSGYTEEGLLHSSSRHIHILVCLKEFSIHPGIKSR